jgi:hypothetical protein
MVALVMIMVSILVEHMPQGALAKQEHSGQRFVFDRADPALCVGIEIRRPWWQRYPLDSSIIDDLLKRGAVFPVPVMDEILARRQEALLLHGHMACHLDHPLLIYFDYTGVSGMCRSSPAIPA